MTSKSARFPLGMAFVLLLMISALISMPSSSLWAQDLEDNIDAELDDVADPGDGSASEDEDIEISDDGDDAGDLENELNADTDASAEGDLDAELADEETATESGETSTAQPQATPAPDVEEDLDTEVQAASNESLAPGSDEPNVDFEKRLAKIYANSEPVEDLKWTELIGEKASEVYQVRSGDTLWDLSRTLFADGFYWSRLWAENPSIKNPHQISRGQKLVFLAGTMASGPRVSVTKVEPDELTEESKRAFERIDEVPAIRDADDAEGSARRGGRKRNDRDEIRELINSPPTYREDFEGQITQEELDAGAVIEMDQLLAKPQIPPPAQSPLPVLRDLPRSFKPTTQKLIDTTVSITQLKGQAETVPPAIVPGYEAFEDEPDFVATIEEVEAGELVAGIGQNVFIKSKEALNPGDRLATYFKRMAVRNKGGSRIGWGYESGGYIEVMDVLDESNGMYRAQVIFAAGPVRVGSIVRNEKPRRVSLTTNGRRNTGEVRIVGGEFEDNRQMFGDSAVVFLENPGNVDLRAGDVMSVQARRGERRSETNVPDLTRPIALIRVFSVQGSVASAVVLKTFDEIRTGDRTGAQFPSAMPDFRLQPPRLSQGTGPGGGG
ncbi:MAG TPA: LysM peptidoglycan-binding domain-containing protein [Pseudobdellovibrionaceae bacterium]|nr:LysM peptidoglycan-binding domain-containing protein [Pseudobdellovibrionaceae bacterium]